MMSIEHRDGIFTLTDNISIDKSKKIIFLSKNELVMEDNIALAFAQVLDELEIEYSVVAGYVAILFGRSRRSDDIKVIARWMDEEEFTELCKRLKACDFSLIQGIISSEESVRKVYREYLSRGRSIRFIYRDIILPNIEFKLASNPLHSYSIENSYTVIINKDRIKIAPLELQIAYKLYLGSDKDIADAVFLYVLFKPVLEQKELERWCKELGADVNMLEGV